MHHFHATGDITRVVILLYATFQSITVFSQCQEICILTCRLLNASATIIAYNYTDEVSIDAKR